MNRLSNETPSDEKFSEKAETPLRQV